MIKGGLLADFCNTVKRHLSWARSMILAILHSGLGASLLSWIEEQYTVTFLKPLGLDRSVVVLLHPLHLLASHSRRK